MPRILLALAIGLVTVLGVLLTPRSARCDPRTAYLCEQLKANDDYRVRTQGALALGASGDDAAVTCLCGGLADSNVSVRVAAAAALGKLGKPNGVSCLKDAEGKEAAPAAKAQIQKSIGSLQAGGAAAPGGAPPAIDASTKYYVAIQVTNKTGRAATEIESLVRATMQSKILARTGFAIAPKAESPSQGGALVKTKRLKGFFLIATVEPPLYEGGSLTQIVRVSMWTYPDKALQGEFSPKLTQSGTSKGDKQSEDLLMKMCIENAVETFQKVAASL